MGGFLKTWAHRSPSEPIPVKESLHVEEQAPTNSEPVLAKSTLEQVVPWAEWKAEALNRLFQEQGVTGLTARITAATVMHGACSPRGAFPLVLRLCGMPIDSDLDFGKGTTRPMLRMEVPSE